MSNIPFNDTARLYHDYKTEIDAAMMRVAASGWWLQGQHNQAFAEAFADYIGVAHCLPLANGTDALELALKAAKHLTSKDKTEVITVANAGGYTSTACRLCDLTPVYVDIDSASQLVDLDQIINAVTEQVCAIVVTHLYGAAVDVPRLRQLLDENGKNDLLIIEDCAQAHGAKVGEARVGSLGDLATFSFYPTKNLGALGDAGAITTQNPEVYNYLKRLHQYGWSAKYTIDEYAGRNSRMDEMQAAILSVILPHLDDMNTRRNVIRQAFIQSLPASIRLLDYTHHDHVTHLCIARSANRDDVMKYLKNAQIACDIHYPILDCDQAAWKDKPMRIASDQNLGESRKSVSEIFTLPCFPQLRDEEVEQICHALEHYEDAR